MATNWYFYDASGNRRKVKKAYFYDGGGGRREIRNAYFYDGSGAPRKFFTNAQLVIEQTGIVVPFASNTGFPPGWLLCTGQAVSRTTYADLFAVIGTTYGVGDGSTTFNVPDLRGEFVYGGNGSNAAPTVIAAVTPPHQHSVPERLAGSIGHSPNSWPHGSSASGSIAAGGGCGTQSSARSLNSGPINTLSTTEFRPRNRSMYYLIRT